MLCITLRVVRAFVLLLLLPASAAFSANNPIIIKDASQLPAGAILAYEHILSFDSRARFSPNGSMAIEENIKVLATGKEIRRGILRTLPSRGTARMAKSSVLTIRSNRCRAMASLSHLALMRQQKA